MLVVHERPRLHRRYEVKGLDYSPCGRYLLAGIERRFRDEWDMFREGRLLRFDLFDPGAEPPEVFDRGIIDVAWSPDGTRALAVTGSRVLTVAEDFETLNVFDLLHAGGLAMPPVDHAHTDGFWVVRNRHAGGLYRLPLSKEGPFRPLDERRDSAFVMQALALRPGDDLAAIGARDAILLARLQPFEPIVRGPETGWVQHLAFSPDGRTLAAASGWRVTLWDVEARPLRVVTVLKGHRKEVTGLAFTPDGRWLLSVSLDETVRRWNPVTGEEGGCYDWGLGALRSVTCAPDGMTAAVGGSGRKSIAVFDLD